MQDLENHYKKMVSDAKKGNVLAEKNIHTSIDKLNNLEDLGDIADVEIKDKLKDISSNFEKLKKNKDINGMSDLIVELNKIMNDIK